MPSCCILALIASRGSPTFNMRKYLPYLGCSAIATEPVAAFPKEAAKAAAVSSPTVELPPVSLPLPALLLLSPPPVRSFWWSFSGNSSEGSLSSISGFTPSCCILALTASRGSPTFSILKYLLYVGWSFRAAFSSWAAPPTLEP